MKAVIMAGGKGVRLYPISAGFPKPLSPVFGIPVIDHITELLKNHGVTEAIATLQYMPEMIINHFEQKSESIGRGLDISWSVEKEPRGTAGSVRDCLDRLDEDFLVISGDAVCDFDLTACMDFHRESGADVTIVLYRHPTPLEYGLVMTDREGKIERFIEKPSWKQVFCDTVNTGIYIINPAVMADVPTDRPFDFAKDLFPALLERGKKLYGYTCEGYWKDIGDPSAYLECHIDIMNGLARLPLVKDLITHSADNSRPHIIPPVSIGKNVTIGRSAVIGPYVALGDGTTVGENTVISGSVIHSAVIHDGAEISGSVLCEGVEIGRDAVLAEGCVLGEGSSVEAGSSLSPCIMLSPGEAISRGLHITPSLKNIRQITPIDENGIISGESVNISTEFCLRLGKALATLGNVGIGYGDTPGEVLAASISCGVRSAGKDTYRHDARFESEANFISSSCGADISVYVYGGRSADTHPRIIIRGRHATLIDRESERKLLTAIRQSPVDSEKSGEEKFIIGAPAIYEDFHHFKGGSLPFSVPESGVENGVLKSILEKSKCILGGGHELSIADGELCITAGGQPLPRETITALLVRVFCDEIQEGGPRELVLPFDTPAALRELISRLGGRSLIEGNPLRADMPGGNQGGMKIGERQRKDSLFLRDPVAAALKLCSHICRTGQSLEQLLDGLPSFSIYRDELELSHDRGAVMRSLAAIAGEKEFGDGVRFKYNDGWVTVAPRTTAQAIRIITEGMSLEAAREISVDIKNAAMEADK